MSFQATAVVAKTYSNAQLLQVTALKLYNDSTLLLGDIATLQTSINAGTATVADMFEMERIIGNLRDQLVYIDNQILILQQQTNG